MQYFSHNKQRKNRRFVNFSKTDKTAAREEKFFPVLHIVFSLSNVLY